MFEKITIGRFYETESPLHSLDPRTKMAALVLYMILLFTAASAAQYALLAAATVIFIVMSRVPWRFMAGGLKPVAMLVLFTAALNILMTRTGDVIFTYGILKITYGGVSIAFTMAARVIMLVTASNLLTLTTRPTVLTHGLEKIMLPLEKIKVPSREIAMMISIALRFIPTLTEEADKIVKAQTARGGGFDEGGLIKKLKAMTPLLVPLFVSAFRRADELAMAMETRCYHGGERTSYRELSLGRRDALAGVFMLALTAIFIALRFGVRL